MREVVSQSDQETWLSNDSGVLILDHLRNPSKWKHQYMCPCRLGSSMSPTVFQKTEELQQACPLKRDVEFSPVPETSSICKTLAGRNGVYTFFGDAVLNIVILLMGCIFGFVLHF